MSVSRWISGAALCAASLCAAAAIGRPALAQQLNCTSVQISPEVQAAAPELRAACVTVTEREGRTLAVVNGEVTRAFADSELQVRFGLPGRTTAPPHAIGSAAEDRVRAGAAAVAVRDLAVGTSVALLIDVEQPQIAIEPPTPADPLLLRPLQAPVATPGYSRGAPSGVLLVGLCAVLIGGALAAYRISRQTT